MRKYFLVFTALASLAGPITQIAHAQDTVVKDGQQLSMTIYGDGRALIEDVRDFDFTQGRSVIVLPNVSSRINAPSASFTSDNIEIIEQNFDFDLLTPNKLMQKAVGETVTIIRTNPGTGIETREKAKVLAVNNGVVVQIGKRIEVLRDDNLPTRVIFDKIPENLRAKPTLSVMVNSSRASTRPATLTYLSGGLSWRADYVLMFDENAKKMDLQGWATLTNNTNTTFENVKTSLIAGHVGNKTATSIITTTAVMCAAMSKVAAPSKAPRNALAIIIYTPCPAPPPSPAPKPNKSALSTHRASQQINPMNMKPVGSRPSKTPKMSMYGLFLAIPEPLALAKPCPRALSGFTPRTPKAAHNLSAKTP